MAHCYTTSPGGKHRQEEALCGPIQGRRECETLHDRPSKWHTKIRRYMTSYIMQNGDSK
jgi:hypothetical protein